MAVRWSYGAGCYLFVIDHLQAWDREELGSELFHPLDITEIREQEAAGRADLARYVRFDYKCVAPLGRIAKNGLKT